MVIKIKETTNCTWMSNGNATSSIKIIQKKFDGFRLDDIKSFLDSCGYEVIKKEED